MLSLDRYIKENHNKNFLGSLSGLKKRKFSVKVFKENALDMKKGLTSERLHKVMMEKYNVKESQAEMLSLKLKRFY